MRACPQFTTALPSIHSFPPSPITPRPARHITREAHITAEGYITREVHITLRSNFFLRRGVSP